MAQRKSLRSLRLFVLLVVGASLLVFSLLFFFIFHTAMPNMLLHSERSYLEKQLSVVSGLISNAHTYTIRMAADISAWNEMERFVQGDNSNLIASRWSKTSPLQAYHFNFMIIKNREGRDIYSEFRDYRNNEPLPMPPGFSSALNDLALEALARPDGKGTAAHDLESTGRNGIFFHKEAPYDLAIMPIVSAHKSSEPVGTIALGRILDNGYFRSLTHYDSNTFELLKLANGGETGVSHIHRESTHSVITILPLTDIYGNPIQLRVCGSRPIYQQGQVELDQTTWLLMATLAIFGLLLYSLFNYFILRPILALSRDVTQIRTHGSIDVDKYSLSKELGALGEAINDMIVSLNASKISKDVLQRILNGIDAYVYVTDPETDEILFINDKMLRHFTLADKAVGQTCWKVLQSGISERCVFCPIPSLLNNSGEAVTWEENNTIDGRIYRNTDSMIKWSNNKVAHLQYSVDITDIKSAETTLKQRLQQQDLMSAMSRIFIASLDMHALFEQAFSMAGEFMDVSKILLTRHKAESRSLVHEYEWFNERHNCYKPEHAPFPFWEGHLEYDAFITNRRPYLAYDDISRDDQCSHAAEHDVKSFIGVPIHVAGEFWGMLSFCECSRHRIWSESDIHLVLLIASIMSGVIQRSETEEQLVRMSTIVERSPQFIYYVSPEGNFKYINPAAQDVSGYSPEELRKGGLSLLFDPSTVSHITSTVIPDILEKEKLSFELPTVRKDGQVRMLSFSAFVADSRTRDVGAIVMDMTEQRLLEKALLEAKELAERSNTAKSDFLSRMSHEMRTPMNAIIGMTAIAKTSSDPKKKEYCLEKIEDASTHLLGVINDILDMSKIEANKFELSYTDFDVEKMLLRVINVVNFRVEEKQQTLIVHMDPDLPQSIVSDDQRLAQVIANLLSNAVKFTPEKGTITLTAELIGEEDGLCTLQFSVTDTGIGVPLAQQGKLFRSFEQADGGVARKFGGTGLGLSISKSIVEMMGGTIRLESEEEKGATFTFSIKAERGSQGARRTLSPDINWSSLRILVVDDAVEVREYFSSLAETIGLSCEVAADALEACDLLRKHSEAPFNIIFVDWKMPEVDGIELTRRIREQYGAGTIVIMISAAAWSDVEKEAKNAGVDLFLPKPLFSSLIVDCINECLNSKETAMEVALDHKETTQSFVGRRILLAEDIDINQEIVISLLEHTGIEIECAENGLKVCEMFAASPSRYDIIFMDIHMPEVDGYEATRCIREMPVPEAAAIPIVAMTANVFREDIERCIEAGMNDHVGKPIDIEEIFSKLRKYVRGA